MKKSALIAALVCLCAAAMTTNSNLKTLRFPMEKPEMNAEEGYIAVDQGVKLYYRRLGSGANVLIVPNGLHLYEDFRGLATGRTLIFFDLRNRGRSSPVTDPAQLARGIYNDVDDLEAVRRHFGVDKASLLGHSYVGLTVVLYASKYPEHAGRVVQIGPLQLDFGKQYPAHLTGTDDTLREVIARLAELRMQHSSDDPQEFCRKFWAVLREIYVVNPRDVARIDWGRCELPNEVNFMSYWTGSLLPSLQALRFSAQDAARVKAPVLTIHGRRDRSAPYGGGRDWALLLPNARLLTVEEAGHAPWIEAPEAVFGAIAAFLEGRWPEAAQQIEPEGDARKRP